jgi:hypothetical protein
MESMAKGASGVRRVARRTAALAGLAAVPVVAVACGGGGSGAPAATTTTPAAARSEPTSITIRVRSVVTGRTAHDAPPRGNSAGDRIEFTDALRNLAVQFGRKANARVGHDRWTMVFTGAHSARLEGEATLPDGKIRFSGPLTNARLLTIPVVGGTGRYAHASGVLVVGAGRTSSVNVYRLVIGEIPGPAA